jgi:hypothetical protein
VVANENGQDKHGDVLDCKDALKSSEIHDVSFEYSVLVFTDGLAITTHEAGSNDVVISWDY